MDREFDQRPLTIAELIEKFSREGFIDSENAKELLETESFSHMANYFDATKKLADLAQSRPTIRHLKFAIDFDKGMRKSIF